MTGRAPRPASIDVGPHAHVAGDVVAGDKHVTINNYFTGGLEAPRSDAAVRNFLAYYVGTPDQPAPFGGRAADLAALDAWLADPAAPPYALLAAPAGRGKSGLLAHWVTRLALAQMGGAPLRHIVFFPISIRFNTNTESVVFAALAARLARLYGEAQPEARDVQQYRGVFAEYLQRAAPADVPVLLVLDGLDEAIGWSAAEDLFPLAPPPHLKVLIAARQLAGDPLGQGWLNQLGWAAPGAAVRFTLDRLDQAGVADALTHMGEPLSALAAQPAFVRTLTTLTEGDSLLLRLYIEALRPAGPQAAALTPEALATFKPGFQAYFDRWFAEQQKLWGPNQPLRDKCVRALLSLCAVALGPLHRDDLLALAPDLFEDSFLLAEAARAVQRFVIGDGDAAGYVFSHPRLDDYFAGRLSAAERAQWQQRFRDYGAHTLAALTAGDLPPAQASGYLVQYYGLHLDPDPAAPPHPAVAALLVEPWLRAHEAASGTPLGFLADARRAWRRAEADGPAALGRQVAAALCFTSVAALSAAVPWDLLAPCVAAHNIPLALGLVLARQKTDPTERARALTALAPLVPEADRLAVQSEALAAVERIASYDQDEALLALADQLPPSLVPAAETIVTTSDYLVQRPLLLGRLAARLPAAEAAPRQQAALALIRAEAPADQVRSLLALLPTLPPDQHMAVIREALAIAQAAEDPDTRAEQLGAVARHLPLAEQPAVLEAAFAAAGEVDWDDSRAALYLELVDVLPPELQTQVRASLAEEFNRAARRRGPAIKASRSAAREGDRRANTGAWTRLVEQFAPVLPDADIQTALAEAWTIDTLSLRAQALAALAPRLPPAEQHALFAQILQTIQTEPDDGNRAWAVSYLVDHLPPDLVAVALAAARGATGLAVPPQDKVPLLRRLAVRLPAELRGPVLIEALAAARALLDEPFRARALAALAAHQPEPDRTQTLNHAWAVVQSIPFVNLRFAEAADLAALPLPDALHGEVLAAIRAAQPAASAIVIAPLLTALAPHLAAPRLEAAIAIARALDYVAVQIAPLTALAARLPQAEAAPLYAELVAGVRAMDHTNLRAEAWVTLLAALPPAARPPLLAEAAATVRTMNHANLRAQRYTGLTALAADPDVHLRLAAAAFTALTQITDTSTRADEFARLMPHLPPSFRHAALQIAGELDSPFVAEPAFIALAPIVADDAELSAALLAAVRAMLAPAPQARTLTALAATLPQPERAALIEEAQAIVDDVRADGAPLVLLEMAARLPAPDALPLLRAAAARAEALPPESNSPGSLGREHAELLAALPPAEQLTYGRALLARLRALPLDQQPQALLAFPLTPLPDALLSDLFDVFWSLGQLDRLRPAAARWAAVCQAGGRDPFTALTRTLHAAERDKRAALLSLLSALAPALADLGGPAALAAAVQAILATGAWWP